MKFYNIKKIKPEQCMAVVIEKQGYGKKKALERHKRYKRI